MTGGKGVNGSSHPKSEWTPGIVKFYKKKEDFGFVMVAGMDDVYFHGSVARTCNVPLPLLRGQHVEIRWKLNGGNKPHVSSIKLA